MKGECNIVLYLHQEETHKFHDLLHMKESIDHLVKISDVSPMPDNSQRVTH